MSLLKEIGAVPVVACRLCRACNAQSAFKVDSNCRTNLGDSSFEVAVLGGISLVDWKLSKTTLKVIMRRFGSVRRFL